MAFRSRIVSTSLIKVSRCFILTGYRITTADKHHLLSQKHSRARNTITVDGKTQAFSHCGYGWIARYLDGKDITYVLGDASKAYVPFDQSAGDWINALTNAGVYTSEHGFILTPEDNPQVKLFRRHLILLRPNILVVYDELEADKDVTWTFQLNGLERSHMKLFPDECLLTADTDNCDAQVKVLGSAPLVASLADTSYVKPFDWLNPQRGRPAIVFEKQQFHSKFENREKCKKMRFLRYSDRWDEYYAFCESGSGYRGYNHPWKLSYQRTTGCRQGSLS